MNIPRQHHHHSDSVTALVAAQAPCAFARDVPPGHPTPPSPPTITPETNTVGRYTTAAHEASEFAVR